MTIKNKGKAIAAALMLPLVFIGCAPNRAQWMADAANQQAQSATADIGSPDKLKMIALDGANTLDWLVNSYIGPNLYLPSFSDDLRVKARRIMSDATLVSVHLRAIGISTTQQAFTNSVFAMCDPDVQAASAELGPGVTAFAGAALTPQATAYWRSFGANLTAVPSKCAQAQQAMNEASQEELQAEANHQANVNAATTVAIALATGYLTAISQPRGTSPAGRVGIGGQAALQALQ